MWLKRWRNTHGFGVHSPFGFQFTQRVVNLGRKYAFYAEAQLREDAAQLHGRRDSVLREAVMLLRLQALSPVDAVRISAPASALSPLATQALAAAGIADIADIATPVAGRTMLIATGAETSAAAAAAHLQGVGNILFILDAPRGLDRQLLAHGNLLIISGRRNLLAIRRPQMQSLLYHMHI